MTNFSLIAGAAGPWRSVQEMLRVEDEARRASTLAKIEQMQKQGAPLEDRIDWLGELRAALADTLTGSITRDQARDALARARQVLAGSLRDPGPHVPTPALEGAFVKLRAMKRGDMLQLDLNLANHPGDAGEPEREKLACSFLERCIAGIRIDLEGGKLDVDEDEIETRATEVVELLEVSGLVPAIYRCARAYQQLDPLPRRGFGLLRPSTSQTSTAANAPDLGGSNGDVEAPIGARSPISPEPSSKRDDAFSGMSSTTARLEKAMDTTSSPTSNAATASSEKRSNIGSPSATSTSASTSPPSPATPST